MAQRNQRGQRLRCSKSRRPSFPLGVEQQPEQRIEFLWSRRGSEREQEQGEGEKPQAMHHSRAL